jgi:hypothetical protein
MSEPLRFKLYGTKKLATKEPQFVPALHNKDERERLRMEKVVSFYTNRALGR